MKYLSDLHQGLDRYGRIFPTHSLLLRRRCVKRHKAAKKKKKYRLYLHDTIFQKIKAPHKGPL